MRPKYIFIDAETRAQNDVCRYYEYATEKRVKPSDWAYTDLTQLWHDPKEEKPKDGAGILLFEKYPKGSTFIWATWYTKKLGEIFGEALTDNSGGPRKRRSLFWENVRYWAYISDILPIEVTKEQIAIP